MLSKFREKLITEFFPYLQEWEHSKFVTAKAIEIIPERNELDEIIDKDNYITQDGFTNFYG